MTGAYPRNTAPERVAIEWMGSELVALAHESGALVLDLRAVVHRSHGAPGVDPGTVCRQPAAVVLANGRWDGSRLALPCEIDYGWVETDCHDYDDMIPCPFSSNDGWCLVVLALSPDERLYLEGDQLTVTFTGDPEFLEDFMPEGPYEESW